MQTQQVDLQSEPEAPSANLDLNVVVPVTPLMDVLRVEQFVERPIGSAWTSLENPFIEPELAFPAFNVNVNTTEPTLINDAHRGAVAGRLRDL